MLAPYGARSLRQPCRWQGHSFLLATLAVLPTDSHPSPRYAPLSPTHRLAIPDPHPPASETQPPMPNPLDPHNTRKTTATPIRDEVQMHGNDFS